MVRVEAAADGTVLFVHAQAGARKNEIVGEHDGRLKVAVTAPPDKGKANTAIAAVLADAFDLSKNAVRLLSGPTSRQKRFVLIGLTRSDTEQKLAKLLV